MLLDLHCVPHAVIDLVSKSKKRCRFFKPSFLTASSLSMAEIGGKKFRFKNTLPKKFPTIDRACTLNYLEELTTWTTTKPPSQFCFSPWHVESWAILWWSCSVPCHVCCYFQSMTLSLMSSSKSRNLSFCPPKPNFASKINNPCSKWRTLIFSLILATERERLVLTKAWRNGVVSLIWPLN